jgi:hypothetical protein
MQSRFYALLAWATALSSVAVACAGPDNRNSLDTHPQLDVSNLVEVVPQDSAKSELGTLDIPSIDAPEQHEELDQLFAEDESTELPADQDDDGLTDGEEALLGTDPMVADSDHDGFGDGEEVTLGTDPLDPSSAMAWHPEWQAFPRLVFGPEVLSDLRLKAIDPGARGGAMLARVQARADAVAAPPKPESYDPYHEAARARIASAAAFIALLFEDEVYAHKAAEIALGINPNINEVGFASPFFTKTSIHAGEAIAYYAKMYDWLRASNLLDDETLGEVRGAVVELVKRFEEEATSGPMAALLALAQNNHNVKAYGAMGLAGMVFSGQPQAARWVNRGVTEVRYYFLDFQTTEDGGYAEGPNYLNYCLGEGLSLLWAYHRFVDGEESYLRHFYDTREVQEEVYEWIPDPLVEPLLTKLFLWPLKIMMPGGRAPNIDDASLSAVSSGYLAVLFNEPVFLWHWELPHVGRASGSGIDLAADIFALLDEEMEGSEPDFSGDLLLEEAGNCVLRSGFGEEDTYALMLGEHGKIRKHGQGHEHPDASQILIHARGEYLLMDSGYISWEEKDAVSHPENHNLILVDGEGPPDSEYTGIGSDTYLSNFHVDDVGYKGCRSETSYAGTSFKRDLLVTPHDVVVVLDRVVATKEQSLELLWHGNGGASSGGDYLAVPGGGAWLRTGASLAATVATSAEDLECDTVTQVHAFSHGAPLEHNALRCTASAQDATFMSLFQIGEGGVEVPVFAGEVIGSHEGIVGLAADLGESNAMVAVWSPENGSTNSVSIGECGEIDVNNGLSVIFIDGSCNWGETVRISGH